MKKNVCKLIAYLESIDYKKSYSGESLVILNNAEKEIVVRVEVKIGLFKIQPQKAINTSAIVETYAAILPIKTVKQSDIILALCEKLPENSLSEMQYSI
jgi:hypothetical protein